MNDSTKSTIIAAALLMVGIFIIITPFLLTDLLITIVDNKTVTGIIYGFFGAFFFFISLPYFGEMLTRKWAGKGKTIRILILLWKSVSWKQTQEGAVEVSGAVFNIKDYEF